MPAKNLIKDEYVNTGRQLSLDYLKSFSIIFMVIVHVLEELTVYFDIGPTTFGKVIEFLAGPLAAPVFMFSMGVGIVYSKHRSPKELILRGLKIWLAAYLLNFFRICILYTIFSNIYDYFSIGYLIYYFFQSDILAFAGLTFILTGILKKINVPLWGMLLIGFGMQFIANLFPFEANTFLSGITLCLLFPCSEMAYFPLFNWYIFPVMGMFIAKYLKQAYDLDYWHKTVLFICVIVLLGLCVSSKFYDIDVYTYFDALSGTYYNQNFFSTIFCLSVVGIGESLIYFIFKNIKSEKIKNLSKYMSNNLNTIYIIQWLIIGNFSVFQYSEFIPWLPVWSCIPLGLIVIFISTYLSKYTKKIFKV